MNDHTNDAEPPPIIAVETAEWFYVASGARIGPVSKGEIERLLVANKLQPDTQVWRKGMKEWASVRTSDLYQLVETAPPPVSGDYIHNSIVWTIAVLPMLVGLVDAALASSGEEIMARCLAMSFDSGTLYEGAEVPGALVFVSNSVLCFWDERRIRRAGYSDGWLTAFALLIVPVYLFVRARRLNQFPSYALSWIASFVFAILFVTATEVAFC